MARRLPAVDGGAVQRASHARAAALTCRHTHLAGTRLLGLNASLPAMGDGRMVLHMRAEVGRRAAIANELLWPSLCGEKRLQRREIWQRSRMF